MSMSVYWDFIIEPMLDAIPARSVVEIGTFKGDTTERLLAYARRHRAVVHVIDPVPELDANSWRRKHRGHLVFHRTPSLTALPKIETYDAVLIDGDHNWYTVFHELRLIARHSTRSGRRFPIVLLHDVGWPYGRRDQYYDPRRIPKAYRRPWKRKGMHPNSAGLLRAGGLNADLCNATREHGQRNGVLTAIEDFLREAPQSLDLLIVPGFHGLGILLHHRLRVANEPLARLLAVWDLPPGLRSYVEWLEHCRIQAMLETRE